MTTERLLHEDITVPEAIVRVLEEAGIDTVFGMPGGKAMKIEFMRCCNRHRK